jgi:hypothetical protein
MNQRQRILAYLTVAIIPLTLFFAPWRVQKGLGTGYMISPVWRPIPFDEGGALPPIPLYAEWGILAAVFVVIFICLRTRNKP